MIELGIEIPLGKYARTAGTYVSRTRVGKFLFGVSKEVLDELYPEHPEKQIVRYGFHCYLRNDGDWYEFIPLKNQVGIGTYEKM